MPLRPSILGGYQAPAGDLAGVKTVVTQPNPTEPRETSRGVYKERALPSPPWKHEKPMGTPSYNGPGASPSAPEQNIHEDKMRTKGLPGEESPVPDPGPRQSPKRRTNMAGMTEPGSRVPDYSDRQKKQRSDLKRYHQRYYKKHRSVIRRRMERWYRKNRKRFNYKKDQRRRREYPNRFKRLPGGFDEGAKRTQEWRDDKKAAAELVPPASFLFLPTDESGFLLSLDVDTGMARVSVGGVPSEIPFGELLEEIVLEDEGDIDRVMSWLDATFGWEADDGDSDDEGEDPADEAFEGWLGGRGFLRRAEMFYEKRPVEGDPSNHYDRAKTPYWREIEKSDEPASDLPSGTVWDNPGSAKVIPEGHDFENTGDKTDRFKKATLRPGSKAVIDAFVRRQPLDGDSLGTDGRTLESLGLGGHEIATWRGPRIAVIGIEDTRFVESVLRYLVKAGGKGLVTFPYDRGEGFTRSITFETWNDMFHRDQTNGGVIASVPWEDRPVGHLDWAEYGGKYHIQMIEVDPAYRRSEVATEMLRKFLSDNQVSLRDVDLGWVTPEGKALFQSVRLASLDVEAALIADIELGCDAALRRRAVGLPVKMVRSDEKNRMWLFDVTGKTGTYRVRAKAVPKGRTSDINKADVLVSCTCPFWRWQGPEHWASSYGYLYGKPRGTAASPDVKDPASTHASCKHVLAVLKKLSGFILPRGGKKAFVAEIRHEGFDRMVSAVSRRYIGRMAKRRDSCQ